VYQFRKWGLRVYIKRKEWQEATNITAHRERQGKRSKVAIDGIAISAEQLNRERAQYGQFDTEQTATITRGRFSATLTCCDFC
jgi:hypothetical protein